MENRKIGQKNRPREASSHISKTTVSSTKTICRRDQTSLRMLFSSSVAFSTSSCYEGSAKTVNNISVHGVPKVTRSLNYIAYLYLIILCCSSCLSVVIANSDIGKGRRYSDSSGSVIDAIPRSGKGTT